MRHARTTRRLAVAAPLLMAVPVQAAQQGLHPGDAGQAVATILVFVVLLLVLRKWAWGPIITQLQQRERAIADAVAKAQKRQTEADDLARHYKTRLESAHAEVEELLAEARREAGEAREQILASAREEAQRTQHLARRELERARREAMKELHGAAAGLATDLAGRLIRRNLTEEEHRRMLNESLEEIRQQAGED
jgi:F-type H+-transporting ATPase subunit b